MLKHHRRYEILKAVDELDEPLLGQVQLHLKHKGYNFSIETIYVILKAVEGVSVQGDAEPESKVRMEEYSIVDTLLALAE